MKQPLPRFMRLAFLSRICQNPIMNRKPPISPNQRPEVVVLGAGLSGLATARELLQRQAARVTVLEKEASPGGMARTLEWGDLSSDLGPHRIYSTLPDMRRWFREEVGEKLLHARRSSRMYAQGQYLRYPPRPAELLQAFGIGGLARFAAGFGATRLRGMLGGRKDDSFGALMEHALGRPLCEAMVFPYTRKTWKCEPDAISPEVARVRATMGSLAHMAKRMLIPEKSGEETTLTAFHYIKGGIGGLAEMLAADLRRMGGRLELNAKVQGLKIDDHQVREVCFEQNGNQQTCAADFVFSSLPITQVASWVQGGPLPERQQLKSLQSLLAFVVLNQSSVGADHWYYFPESTPEATRAYEPRNFDESLGTKDRTILCVEMTLPSDAPLNEDADAAKGLDLARQLAKTRLFSMNNVLEVHTQRLPHAYPFYAKGYEPALNANLGCLRKVSNILPLGRQGLFWHNNMDHAIHCGHRAAQTWLDETDPRERWYDREHPDMRGLHIVD